MAKTKVSEELLRAKWEVLYRAAYEGFDYAFRFYSNFKEVKDPTFHQLRKEYVKAGNALEKYLKAGFSKAQLEMIDNEENPFGEE